MRKFPVLVDVKTAGLALLGVTIAGVCYLFEAQCTMYGNKIKAEESRLESLEREKKVQEVKWARLRSHEELVRICRAYGIHMEKEPKVQQFARIFKSPAGGAQPWSIRYHPDTQAAIANGGSPFEFVKNLPAAGAVKKR
jgi:hypothetical protein